MKKEYYTVYSQSDDMTFKMCNTYREDGTIASSEVVGFSYGEYDDPNDIIDGLKAIFE